MKNAMLLVAALAAGLTAMPASAAQDQDQPTAGTAKSSEAEHFYKLTFVVEELNAEGKPVNSRSYTTTASTQPHSSERIRTGARVPIPVGMFKSGDGENEPSQWQYQDVGIDFDVSEVQEVSHQLALRVNADVSSIAPSQDVRSTQAVIRKNQWGALVLIPVGKATPIFTSDDVDGKGALQVVALATLLQ
jgi:hypothetical protein